MCLGVTHWHVHMKRKVHKENDARDTRETDQSLPDSGSARVYMNPDPAMELKIAQCRIYSVDSLDALSAGEQSHCDGPCSSLWSISGWSNNLGIITDP